jgi:CrcB protein
LSRSLRYHRGVRALILVAIGGAVGAVGRHLVGLVASGILGKPSPYGTLVVNVLGSFMLGALVTWAARVDAPPDIKFLLGTGLCGALTTFSTFSVETLQLLQQGHRGAALANIALNLVLGLGAAAAGMALFSR